jgi:nicotinate-nucleotide--dimethylbenzimidazole phosphoribosyltransferase
MTTDEFFLAINKGKEIVDSVFAKGSNTIGFGEMGIGNTSSAALLMHKYCGVSLSKCVGRGTGHNDAGLRKKTAILKKVVSRHSTVTGALNVLATFGGFEIAMMTGAMLRAAELNMIILVDGFIVTSALLGAYHIEKEVLDNCIFCHQSDEAGHKQMLEYFKVEPLLNLDMRLGEGSAAAVALPIIQSAVNFLNEMASFEDAGVSNKE